MEIRQILENLWRQKIALAVVLVVALLAAVQMGGRSGGPPTGAATGQILIDSPQSALASLKQNTLPLTTRAGVFAQLMASSAVRDAIGRATGLPPSRILAQGPFDDPAAAPTGAEAPKLPETATLRRGRPYSLTFVSQQDLPLITVYAQAPTPQQARRLVDGVGTGVQAYVDGLQANGTLPVDHRVVIRTLGHAEAAWVRPGSGAPMAIAAFIAVMLLGSLALLAVPKLGRLARRRDWDEESAYEYDAPDVDFGLDLDDEPVLAPEPEPDPPATPARRRRRGAAASAPPVEAETV